MIRPDSRPYAGRYALRVFCVFGFEPAIWPWLPWAAIILTRSSSMTNVRELVCLPDAFYGRDYINVTNPLASGRW